MFTRIACKVLPGDAMITWVQQNKNALYNIDKLGKIKTILKDLRAKAATAEDLYRTKGKPTEQ